MKSLVRSCVLIGLAGAAFLSASAHADSNYYAGVGFGLSQVSGGSFAKNSGVEMSGVAGYKFNKNFSAEAEYIFSTGQKIGTADVNTSALALSVVGQYPISGGMSAYGKLGFADASVLATTTSASASTTIYGAGVQFESGEQTYRVGVSSYGLDTTLSKGGSQMNAEFVVLRSF